MLTGLKSNELFSTSLRTGVTAALLLLFSATALSPVASAAPAMLLAPPAGPPTTTITVSGTGFSPSALVDVYFDVTDLCLSIANVAGNASCAIKVPKDAQPQTHWISMVQRSTGTGAQKSFVVRTDWTEFRGMNPKHTGFNPYENTIDASNVRNLDTLWAASIGVTYSTPVVWAGRVYIGGYDGKLYAVSARSGATIGGFPKTLGGPVIASSAAVGQGNVYVATAGTDNKLYAFNATTGAAVAGFPIALGGEVHASPTLYGGNIYVACMDGKVYAFNAATGASVSGFPITVGTGASLDATVSAANGRIYIGSTDQKFYAFDAATGAPISGFYPGYPKDVGVVESTAAIVSGQIFFSVGNGSLWGLHGINGADLSGFPVAGDGWIVQSSPAIGDGQVITTSSNHNVYSRDPGSGALRWSTTLDDNIYASPVIANGLVYVNSGKSLVALNEANGMALWRASVFTFWPASPVVADGIVFIASIDGHLYAFSQGGRAPSSRLPGGELGVLPALSSLKPDPSLRPSGK